MTDDKIDESKDILNTFDYIKLNPNYRFDYMFDDRSIDILRKFCPRSESMSITLYNKIEEQTKKIDEQTKKIDELIKILKKKVK